jgi:hypothetical protein
VPSFESLVMTKSFFVALNTEPCDGTSELYDSNSEYTKSVCVMRPAMNFNDAFHTCLAMRMELFNVTEDKSQVALYEYLEQHGYIGNLGPNFWTDDGEEECKMSTVIGNTFEQFATDCFSTHSYICEYRRLDLDNEPSHASFMILSKLILCLLVVKLKF